ETRPVHGGQRCAHSTSFDGYSATGSLARRGRRDPTSPVETASAGSDAVCHPTTTVSTELNRSLAAQQRSDVGTCRSIDQRLKQVARMSEAKSGYVCLKHLRAAQTPTLGDVRSMSALPPERWGNRPSSLWIAEDLGCCASG